MGTEIIIAEEVTTEEEEVVIITGTKVGNKETTKEAIDNKDNQSEEDTEDKIENYNRTND